MCSRVFLYNQVVRLDGHGTVDMNMFTANTGHMKLGVKHVRRKQWETKDE